MYGEAMRVLLPDTYGSTQFFRDAPDWAADWTGVRLDSKDPYAAGEEALAFFAGRGRDPRRKLLIPSDGLDVGQMLGLHAAFGGRMSPVSLPPTSATPRTFRTRPSGATTRVAGSARASGPS